MYQWLIDRDDPLLRSIRQWQTWRDEQYQELCELNRRSQNASRGVYLNEAREYAWQARAIGYYDVVVPLDTEMKRCCRHRDEVALRHVLQLTDRWQDMSAEERHAVMDEIAPSTPTHEAFSVFAATPCGAAALKKLGGLLEGAGSRGRQ